MGVDQTKGRPSTQRRRRAQVQAAWAAVHAAEWNVVATFSLAAPPSISRQEQLQLVGCRVCWQVDVRHVLGDGTRLYAPSANP